MTTLIEAKAEEIVGFATAGKSMIADSFIICHGNSQAHVKGIADRVELHIKKQGTRPNIIEGYSEGVWIVIDYGTLVVHIFHPEARNYYQLEELYSAFKQISIPK